MPTPLSPSRNANLPAKRAPKRKTAANGPQSPPKSSAGQSNPPKPSETNENSQNPVSGYRSKRKRQKVERDDDMAKWSDERIWDKSDTEIIETSRLSWRSYVYDHYTLSVIRGEHEGKKEITFQFSCRFGDSLHMPLTRKRSKAGSGTSNLIKTERDCVLRDPSRGQLTHTDVVVKDNYSEPRHRAIIALRCAVFKRSFHSVDDKLYKWEVELLRPGTILPSPVTVQRDVHRLYENLAPKIRVYFEQQNREIHIVIDGWTAPINTSNLGVVIVWEDYGKLFRAVLEFIELNQSHTGEYLAEVLAKCLKRFGLEKFVCMLQMDNAGNCNTTAIHLPRHISNFLGIASRPRCFTHIIQLIAESITIFFKQLYARKRNIAVSESDAVAVVLDDGEEAVTEEDKELAQIQDEEADEAEEAARQTGNASSVRAKQVHDRKVATSQRDRAVAAMESVGVVISPSERKEAITIFPKMSGLSRKTHDVHLVQTAWKAKLEANTTPLTTDATTLARRNATRWGSEHDCLQSHISLKPVVMELFKDSHLKIGSFKLSDSQWVLADWLRDILYILRPFSVKFQDGSKPLIFEVLPSLLAIIQQLHYAYQDATMPNVCRVATYSGLKTAERYLEKLKECDAYEISIEVERIKLRVIERFDKDYRPRSENTESQPLALPRSQPTRRSWGNLMPTEPVISFPVDDIRSYLAEPLAPLPDGMNVLQYWEGQKSIRPTVSKFALAFCSIPATVCDVEREFSEGRNQINWNQHRMGSDTFRAQMGLGSWFDAPWFDLDLCENIIAEKGGPLRQDDDSETNASSST